MINIRPKSRLNYPRRATGFALPTILIVALVMLSVLVIAASSLTEIRTALNSQYYNKLASEAAESGAARAAACLQESGYVAQWGSNPLRPNTSCSGGNACTNNDSCFVISTDKLRTTFEVAEPEDNNVSQSVQVTGKTELIRSSSGAPWRTFTQVIKARVGTDLSFSKIAFGYFTSGAHFITIGADSKARGVGANNYGQLGIGSSSTALQPSPINLPSGVQAASAYSNFKSEGFTSFIIGSDGNAYGFGLNNYRQLGDGTTTGRRTPVKFQLPSGKQARHVLALGFSTYVSTTDNNIYASGLSDHGLLGTGTSSTSSPARVRLPTPNPSNPNTIPTNDIVGDRSTVFVRMEGGAVYGWGRNDTGQLARGNTTSSNVPIKIGDYGDSGKPKAVDIAFDGETVYIVDDTGRLQASGSNHFGQLGRERNVLHNSGANRCMDNYNGNATNGNHIVTWTCNDSGPQDWLLTDEGFIKNIDSGMCLDDMTPNNWFDFAGIQVELRDCTQSRDGQLWQMGASGEITNIDSGRCLHVGGSAVSGSRLENQVCNGDSRQKWSLRRSLELAPVDIPTSSDIVQVDSDQFFASALTANGRVWSFGTNHSGVFGSGSPSTIQMIPKSAFFPMNVHAADIYVTSTDYDSGFSNLFIITTSGSVYGSGNDTYGQLGLGSTAERRTMPAPMGVINGTSVKARDIVSGYGTTVILTTDGKVYTVGHNSHGQLGDGTTNDSSTPKANRHTNVVPMTVF